jgi:hypothetical protein
MHDGHPVNVILRDGIKKLDSATTSIFHTLAAKHLLEERLGILVKIGNAMKTLKLDVHLHAVHLNQFKASIEFLVTPESK